MSPRFLLDTNVLSELARKHPNPAVLGRIESNSGQLATAAPVWHELRFGCARAPSPETRMRLERFLAALTASDLEILPYDEEAADWHARERARLVALGRTPSFVDGQIAAVAAVRDLVLVTANEADFRGFNGLRVENWH
jgi:tRNA(fMet)-specific endonuclease VapC